MKVKIEYKGRRFPRIVNLRGGDRISFLQNRRIIELEEYDALLLLQSNTRMTPEKWEFTFFSDMKESVPGGWAEGETQSEDAPEDKQAPAKAAKGKKAERK